MKTNADVDFEISAEDMEVLKNFKHIESYGESSRIPGIRQENCKLFKKEINIL